MLVLSAGAVVVATSDCGLECERLRRAVLREVREHDLRSPDRDRRTVVEEHSALDGAATLSSGVELEKLGLPIVLPITTHNQMLAEL